MAAANGANSPEYHQRAFSKIPSLASAPPPFKKFQSVFGGKTCYSGSLNRTLFSEHVSASLSIC